MLDNDCDIKRYRKRSNNNNRNELGESASRNVIEGGEYRIPKMTDEKIVTDYANLAFNPYAISTDDLSNEDDLKKSKSLDNHGYEGKIVEESNPHYEDTLEVAKKAGLTGTGRRKKENIIYEDAAIGKNKNKTNTKNGPRLRNSALPAPPTKDWQGKRSNTWKIPFAILCFLILICIAASAFGVLAYLDSNSCTCESSPISSALMGKLPNASRITGNSELISQLKEELKALQKELESFKTEQRAQDKLQQTLNSSLEKIDSTFNAQFKAFRSNVSHLTRDLGQFGNDLHNVNNFTQQLRSTIDNINSTFTIKLTNVSKQIGPRGYNGSQGSQGPEGPQGVGNLSLCFVREEVKTQTVSDIDEMSTKSQVKTVEKQGFKILGATCTTAEHYGASQTVISTIDPPSGTHPYTYLCTCVGVSQYGSLAPSKDQNNKRSIKCIIKYWECPLLT